MHILNFKKTIYTFLYGGAFFCLDAQVPNCNIQFFSNEDGMSSKLTNCILEDSRGLVWIGTQSGVNRFDGEEFRVFDKNNPGLANNSVTSLYDFPHHPTLLNLKDLSQEAIQLFEPMAEAKKIKLRQDISPTVSVKADRDTVSMILRNIASNALKFSQEGDLVKVTASQKNGNVLLAVKDLGIGMTPEVISKLFALGNKIKREQKVKKEVV